MTEFEGRTFSEGGVEFTIHEHLAVIDYYEDRENDWRKELNIVSWNGGQPKIDVRDWNETHDRMSRGITLTEEQADKLAMALGRRMMNRQKEKKEIESFDR